MMAFLVVFVLLGFDPTSRITFTPGPLVLDEGAEHGLLQVVDFAVLDTRFFVLDRGEPAVKLINEKGAVLHRFGEKGQGPGEFLRPTRVQAHDGRLWVFESEKGVVYTFQPDGTYLDRIRLMRGYDIVFYDEGFIISVIVSPHLFHHFDLQGNPVNRFGEGFTGTTGFENALAKACQTFLDAERGVFYAFYTHGRFFESYDLKSGKLIHQVALPFHEQFALPPRQVSQTDKSGAGRFFQENGTPLLAVAFHQDLIWVLLHDERTARQSRLAVLNLEGEILDMTQTPRPWTYMMHKGNVFLFTNRDLETIHQMRLDFK